MSRFARSERQELADLLLAVGPDAATLDEGWTTRDLAAHLVLRERRPDAAAGILLPPVRRHTDRVQARLAAIPYQRLVELVRQPPWWSPVSNPLVHEQANLMEFFVHHEDVRRAGTGWQPRNLPAAQQAALWRRLPALARLALRRFPATVLVQAPEHGETSAGGTGDQLRLVGAPGELILFLFGRQRAARVQLDGPAALVERLRTARLGV
ncbi:TIGR03085 family metal-binding protein [Plantactinospora sp. KBS50]|uniref:TIGR03085 family metal-binding protein n=1 Tax=Plantactinospora sp. KBS50 TaxID=2024580 RepID=UPI000BAAD340|nr:TIGR03085 family metal-binding protein [Plantactinospora sp. KBS50]ASW55996.1 TIGR03085 family protein [Plantactinospora sp. KBS50]